MQETEVDSALKESECLSIKHKLMQYWYVLKLSLYFSYFSYTIIFYIFVYMSLISMIQNNQNSVLLYDHIYFISHSVESTFYFTACCFGQQISLQISGVNFKSWFYFVFYTYEVRPENSRIYRVKIFPSYLEAIQPCRLQSTPLYSVCTAASFSSMF